jgi:hypothetical protein
MATIDIQPGEQVIRGQRVTFTANRQVARPPGGEIPTEVTWSIEGVPDQPVNDPANWHIATWDVPGGQPPGVFHVEVVLTFTNPDAEDRGRADVIVLGLPFTGGDRVSVGMRRADIAPTSDQAFWVAIRNSTGALSFNRYLQWIDPILCGGEAPEGNDLLQQLLRTRALPFPDMDAYRVLKIATEAFMLVNCGVRVDTTTEQDLQRPFRGIDPREERQRLGFEEQIESLWQEYISSRDGDRVTGEEELALLPYLAVIRLKLGDVDLVDDNQFGRACFGILRNKFTNPCLLELIWSYWHEEAMLVQTLNAISMRFQNRRGPADRDPLAQLEIDPLQSLNNLLWGYIQDEQHQLTVPRRAYEYDHHYGLTLYGKAVPPLRPADSRSRFLEAFHNLLQVSTIFLERDDDTTVIADGFPVLNALKEVHLLLTEGQHNQYGDLPWTARQEMLMQEWLLARPEMRAFLPGRTMVAYPEQWMDRVDAMKRMQEWTDISSMHFRDLGVFGEQLLLGIRYGNWNSVIQSGQAANWVRYWRAEIQGYIHAYRAVTGVDLTLEPVDSTMPAVHLRRRLAEQLGTRAPKPLGGRIAAQLTRTAPAQLPARAPAQLPSVQQTPVWGQPLGPSGGR